MSGSARTFAHRLLVGVSFLSLAGCASTQPPPSPDLQSPLNSTSPATALATATPTPAATPTITAPTATQNASPGASPTDSPGSFVIGGTSFANLGASWGSFQWSPDGEWLLLRRGNYVSLIRMSDVSLVRKYEVPNADYAESTWIDSDSFFVYTRDTALRGSVTSADLVPTDIPWDNEDGVSAPGGLANGRGAIAFAVGNEYDHSCATSECPRFQVWSDGIASGEVKGWPAAWSLDGTRLAVVRPLPRAGAVDRNGHVAAAGFTGDAGWLEVLTYPGLQPVYTNRDLNVDDMSIAYSPSARYLLFGWGDEEVLDLQTAHLTQAPTDRPLYWYGDELVTRNNGDLVAYSLDGSIAQRWNDFGDGPLAASADGTLAVTTDNASAPTAVNVVRNGQAVSFSLPSVANATGVERIFPTAADNGRAVALETEGTDVFHPLLVLKVPD